MAQFINMQAGAADAMVVGGIIVPEFQKEIVDIVKRTSILGDRIQYVPAVGSPSRWFEQTAIQTATFTATGGSGGGTITATNGTPTRVEHALQIKGLSAQLTYSLFDLETIGQQNVFPELKAKDMMDMINSIALLHGQALWNGTDTVNGGTVGNSGIQYVGLVNQISTIQTILSSVSIIDSIRTQCAKMAASTQYNLLGQKYSIYINPLALDYLEQEAKNAVGTVTRYMESDVTSVGVGLTVSGIRTALGTLPLIPEPFLGMNSFGAAAPTNQNNYPFAIVCESLVEYQYIGSKIPRIFELGTLQNLNSTYTSVMFGAPVVKGASYAHVIGNIQR
jgi:hypothetical protein